MSGTLDVGVAGGVHTMTQIPISSAMTAAEPLGFSDPFSGSTGWVARYGAEPPTQFKSAQMIADHWGISREDLERYSLESHRRALAAIAEGRFDREILPLEGVTQDETPRQTSMEKMAELDTLFGCNKVTAAVSSQTCDASSAMLVVSEAALKRYNLTPRARIHHMSVRADDPIWMLTAPIPATRYALDKAGLRMQDIDLVEINEAFASVALAWLKELDYPHEQTNVNGGGIALGHPLGATGTSRLPPRRPGRGRRRIGNGIPPRTGPRPRGRHCPGSPLGPHRDQADDHAAARAGAAAEALRPADHVRGRGAGQRHHH